MVTASACTPTGSVMAAMTAATTQTSSIALTLHHLLPMLEVRLNVMRNCVCQFRFAVCCVSIHPV